MVEGDAAIASYVDAEGKPRQALNVTHRMLPRPLSLLDTALTIPGNLEVLRRPYNPATGEGEQQQQ